MKKLLLILIILAQLSCNSQETVQLEKNSGGLFVTEITLNGKVSVKALVDTGCSELSIPAHVFYTLVNSGTVCKEDQLPSRTYILADGSEVVNSRFLLREIKIGTRTFNNISVSITQNPNASILIGQNVLSKFGVIMFDYENNLMIFE